ncbi:guanylate kinase [Streptosporangium becharense]|uniref:Guanylate kinase n=1 Tax=Streptosporangium becharense TaxID=1816182 RepID=A0A7W9MHM6_9ACTN|nr:guanylate kinase [Streptosporangium becharense]MBB2912435.1 guanylate kinase [Streptosporangium becharense]MBB5820736.1 guanylate kinase [Streptosporangium becharense]
MNGPLGIVLYGPPASGKDTVTAALARLDARFSLLPKLKVGTGRGEGYEFVSAERLAMLRDAGRLVAETHRYGNVYAVDRLMIDERRAAGHVPVTHMGNLADLRRLIGTTPDSWLRVLLWVPREVTEQRSKARGDVDTGRRLAAWDETLTDLETGADAGFFHLRLHTDRIGADAAAREIMRAYDRLRDAGCPQVRQSRR